MSFAIDTEVERIRIETRRALNGLRAGTTHSKRVGTGFAFDQLREYQQGDDVRFIDWNSSARTGSLLVKNYFEERDRAMHIIVDISGSMDCGSGYYSKHELAMQASAVLSYVGYYSGDAVGYTIAGQSVYDCVAPKKGLRPITATVQKLLSTAARPERMNWKAALYQTMAVIKNNALIVVVSDFIESEQTIDLLRALQEKNEVIVVRCLDLLERELPSLGYVYMSDPESGRLSLAKTQDMVMLAHRLYEQTELMRMSGFRVLDVTPQRPVVTDIASFFSQQLARW